MLNCAEVQDRLSERMDGELRGAESVRVEAHLGQCTACRAVAEELRELDRFLLGPTIVPVDPHLSARLCEHLFERGEVRPGATARVVQLPLPAGSRSSSRRPLLAAAMTLLALTAVAWLAKRERPRVQVAERQTPAVSAVGRTLTERLEAIQREVAAIERDLTAFKDEARAESVRSEQTVISRNMGEWKR